MNQFNANQRALRSKIRTQMAELVQKQKKLKLEGASMLELEEVSGEMEVLRKELQSVEDSGHTVFMSAKQMLAPKKELSQKQKKISWKKKHIEIRLNSLNKDLKDLEQSSEECTLINDKIAKFQKELSDLNQEQNAVNDLNHTRFLDAQNVEAEEAGQEQDLKKVNSELEELNSQILENGSKLATAELAELKERLHFLELEKESIENFTHDEFLENTKAMKAKRKSQLR
jgi:DNA repair exonuclease SbcCD ATPase subunit